MQPLLSGPDLSGMIPLSDIGNDPVWMKIQELDLDPIKLKLMFPHEETGVTLEDADQMVGHYRKFLFLTHRFRDQAIVPTRKIDEVWHAHILDTEKYARDCQFVFGYFLHHFPYLGMRGVEDEMERMSAFQNSERLFLSVFSEPYTREVESGSLCFDGQGGCIGGDHIGNQVRPTLASFGKV